MSRFGEVARRLAQIVRRLRRVERREVAEFRRWLETTDNLIHVSVLFLVPLLIALVTFVANALTQLRFLFLLFPPLTSGAYTLFADPEGRYASPRKFVTGTTLGALCGWLALELSATFVYRLPPESATVNAGAAALAVFLTGATTWAFDLELPTAFSTALLVLLTGDIDIAFVDVRFESALAYTLGVAVSTSVVAAVFSVWRREFYEQRAQLLYGTTRGDDHVLVPMRGDDGSATRTAVFGARLAAAHEAGKVVLLDVVDGERRAEAERAVLAGEGPPTRGAADIEEAMAAGDENPNAVEETAENVEETVVERVEDRGSRRAAAEAADRLESQARRIRTQLGVPCEVVVASGDPAQSAIKTARATNCDLIVAPYEEDQGSLSEFVRSIFRGPLDAVAFRSTTGADEWRRVLVAVSRPGDSAHAMIDFATRLAGPNGDVSVCTCIGSEMERRSAESRLADMVETATDRGTIETRVARSAVTEFIDANAGAYDLIVLGSSGDRSAASRFVSPPTFERLRDVDCDVAVVDRGR